MFFFFNDTATTEIYTLSLHDALPIYARAGAERARAAGGQRTVKTRTHSHARSLASLKSLALATLALALFAHASAEDRKSTRLNSSHANISYAVFCLKKKKVTNSPLTS